MPQIPYTQWIPLAPLFSGLKPAQYQFPPAYRIEGDLVRFCGTIDATSGGGSMLVPITPPRIIPDRNVTLSSAMLSMTTGGIVACSITIYSSTPFGNPAQSTIQLGSMGTNDGFVYLDGLVYVLRTQ